MLDHGVVDVLHGVAVPDPYRWLEDAAAPRTRDWTRHQTELWRAVRDDLPGLDLWRKRLAEHLDIDFESAPVRRGDTTFVMRHIRGGRAPGLYASRNGEPGRDLLRLLPDRLKADGALQSWQPSPDGRLLALTLSNGGSEQAELLVMAVGSGRMVDGPIDGCGHTSIAWRPDGNELFYSRRPRAEAGNQVFLHRIGSDPGGDQEIFAAPGGGQLLYSLTAGPDGRWLAISVSDGSPAGGNELWLVDLATGSAPQRIQERGGANSGITFGPDGLLYLMTNWDAPNWRIMVADPQWPGRRHWRELIGSDPEAIITDFALLTRPEPGRMLVAWSRDAVAEISVHNLETGARQAKVPLPGMGKVGPLAAQGEEVCFSYTDLATPPTVLRYPRRREPRRPIAGLPERVWCTSADGTRVQLLAMRQAGRDGPGPTILTGYGGFGISMPPCYSAATAAWLTAGGTYLIANVRGGGERGERWHAAGRGRAKQNAIDDFLACAQHVLALGWTTPDQLAIWGASNGALLMAAALTQRPDLFAAAICSAPLCDMVRYELSGMGARWRSEYGSASDPLDFGHLLAYSPYHNVRPGTAYPATLFAVSEHDERVDPSHARKMCAALQHATSGEAPVVLRRETHVAHDIRSLAASVELGGDILAFIAAHTGMGT